jgi:two-component system phosphate regulon sensor histidine kinase PhoR
MMKVLRLWRKEATYIALYIVIAAVLSHFLGYFMHMVVLILIYALVKQAVLLYRLEQWLSHDASGKTPTETGAWGDVYFHFYRIKQKEKKRKKTLGKIIEQFRKSTDVLPDAALVLGDHNEIIWSNKLAKIVLGIKKSDRGQPVSSLIRSPEFAEFIKARDAAKSITLPSPINEKIILQYKIVGYANEQHLVIAHDVTRQKLMDTMRKNFVDNVSHELRTPLTVLKGYLETLQDMDDNQSAMLTKSLLQMNAQTDRMQYLVDDLLLLARLETQKKKTECVDVANLINNICLESGVVEDQYQRIELNVQTGIDIMGEEQDLRSAFSNLIINALKYSADQSPVKVVWKKSDQGAVFEVTDQGEGIATEDIPRVTERFFRAEVKRSKKLSGTGLGLAIVKHVLIRHDATLEINSKLGKGSRFRCIFPVARIC